MGSHKTEQNSLARKTTKKSIPNIVSKLINSSLRFTTYGHIEKRRPEITK